ncbi:chorismate mutase [Burkholderia ubonensis]|uniref:chorismate mutase n=1 Tax=Burkholderia ubonensis TaxID=101571 RepID=UPI00075A22D6|nr:chorismate mutase [Burkholderia ubonensis]KWB75321.1 chorismate mutase [Burkholderia ubonensis]
MGNVKVMGTLTSTAAALMLSGIVGCSDGAQAQVPTFEPLVQKMAERLLTADLVALNKWDSGGKVYDPVREAQVIAAVSSAAASYGLQADDVSAIFTDQMEANKTVQYALLNTWRRAGGAPTTPRQSLDEIRRQLDALQGSILQGLADTSLLRSRLDCQTQIAMVAGRVTARYSLDPQHSAALDRAVARVCRL